MPAISPHHEIDPAKLTRDTRSAGQRLAIAFFRPNSFRLALLAFGALQLYLPAFWPLWLVILLVLTMSFQDQRFTIPLRMPKGAGGIDRTDYSEVMVEENRLFGWLRNSRAVRKFAMAGGILYMGYLRSPLPGDFGRELWLNDSDCRTHMFL